MNQVTMNAFEVLGLQPGATQAEVQAAWRRLAGIHHPDKGGDAAEFNRLRTAFHEASELSLIPPLCATCNGTKKIQIQRGFAVLDLPCPDCG